MSLPNTIDAKTNFAIWRFCAWSGPVYLIAYGLCWAGVGKFFPPPAESWSAAQVVNFYTTYNMQIRIGMALSAFFAPLYFVWSCLTSQVIKHIEGPNGMLSSMELIGGALTALVIALFAIIWLTASFRLETRTPGEIQLINDFGWMVFDMTFMITNVQLYAFGAAILLDRRTDPLIPRWMGWYTLVSGIAFLPVGLIPFFITGPFAWDGALTFEVPLTIWAVWDIAICYYVFKAISKIEIEMGFLDTSLRAAGPVGYTRPI